MARSVRPPVKDDRCKLCGERIYQFWVDSEPHNNECLEGAQRVTDCQTAMQKARDKAAMLKDPVFRAALGLDK